MSLTLSAARSTIRRVERPNHRERLRLCGPCQPPASTLNGTISPYVYTAATADPDGCGTIVWATAGQIRPISAGCSSSFTTRLDRRAPIRSSAERAVRRGRIFRTRSAAADPLPRDRRRDGGSGARDLGDADRRFRWPWRGRLSPRPHRGGSLSYRDQRTVPQRPRRGGHALLPGWLPGDARVPRSD